MSDVKQISLALFDALQQTVVNPGASFRWHALLANLMQEQDEAVRAWVEQCLVQQVPADGVAGFLRASFLAHATGKAQYRIEAGQIVQAITPFDPERQMAFAIFEWGRELAFGGSHHQMIKTLRDAQLPQIMAGMGQRLKASALPARTVAQVRKVALVVPYLSDARHTPTLLAFEHARMLQQTGLVVEVFSAQDSMVGHMPMLLGNNGAMVLTAPTAAGLADLAPAGVGVRLADEAFSLKYRWHETAQAIAGFDPDLVFFIGLMSPLMFPLYASRPVLGLCVHATPLMAPVDVWLCSNPQLATPAPWGDCLPAAHAHEHPWRVRLHADQAPPPKDRAALGLPDAALVLVCMGSRLIKEVVGPWAERMVAWLQAHPGVCWLLVGSNGSKPALLEALPEQQIRVLPHQHNVRGILRLCDVYVNPDRVGGGFNVAEAMAEGLPVLALAGSDGGDKLGPFAAPDIDTWFAQLDELAASSQLRRQRGQQLQQRFATRLDLQQATPSLLAACELARQHFQRRNAAMEQAAQSAT